MRIFITGATGFVGSAVVRELLTHGHNVLGLARSEASAAALERAGAGVLRGSLADLDSLKRGVSEADGVIHCAFDHDFSNFAASARAEQAALEALGAAIVGSDRPIVITGGTIGLAPGRLLTEDDVGSSSLPRKAQEIALALAARGVRASVIRLSPSVHGDGDRGMVPSLIQSAREKGFVTYVGAGENRWSAVHRLDAARLYRLALEKGIAGARYHAVDDEGVPIRAVAEVIGRRLGVPAVSKSPEEAASILGFIGHVLAMDGPASNALTRERLGWAPTERGLLEDLEKGTYFDA
ncbi:SDR family oxidoreductase [Polyangium sp. 6x1]|uniref:SDR family oxidoreductase n=1 Tax=Polyangium sp. 6x1 TaxID=3042689 RepID=UPI0024824D66|nr:SDR family oxidoreductase [Polyangium sp. 6x1]MDI1446811.1 SDR family oxidoreductase [Polyangium sp. 6x1]